MWKVRLQGGVRRFNTHPIRVLWGKEKLYLKRDYSTDSRSPVRKWGNPYLDKWKQNWREREKRQITFKGATYQ